MTDKKNIINIKQFKVENPNLMSPAQLAYVGDAVYELLVRTYLVTNHNYNANDLHKAAIKFVKAEKQASFLKNIDYLLTDEEKKIAKRGRNAKITSIAKNASMIDYRYATAFEALLGYLYLKNENERIYLLFDEILKIKGIS